MRKMKNKHGQVNVIAHVMTRNFWEYYITDQVVNSDIVEAVVMGYETEIGDISLKEIKPYVTSCTQELNEIMPAEGWEWVEE